MRLWTPTSTGTKMTAHKKSPGLLHLGDKKLTRAFKCSLTVRSLCCYRCKCELQDKHSLTHKPTYLAIASLMHCEISPRFVADHQESRPIFVLPRVDNGPTPDCHDRHNRNGDGWNNEYRPLAALRLMSGKWGW